MSGTLSALDDRHLAFAPTQVSVLGIPQARLLRALGIELASLTPLQRRGAALRGDMKMFNVLELNVRALIRNSADANPMRFDLDGYRSQVAQGSVRMPADGTLVVDLGQRNPLAAR